MEEDRRQQAIIALWDLMTRQNATVSSALKGMKEAGFTKAETAEALEHFR